MNKRDRTVQGRAPNAGRNLHEQPTRIIERDPAGHESCAPRAPLDLHKRKRKPTLDEIAEALAQFQTSKEAQQIRDRLAQMGQR